MFFLSALPVRHWRVTLNTDMSWNARLLPITAAFLVIFVQNVEGFKYVQLKESNPPITGVQCPAGSRCSWRYLHPLNPKSVLITRTQKLQLMESSRPGEY